MKKSVTRDVTLYGPQRKLIGYYAYSVICIEWQMEKDGLNLLPSKLLLQVHAYKGVQSNQTIKVPTPFFYRLFPLLLAFIYLIPLTAPMVTAPLISNEQVQSFIDVNSGTPLKRQLPTYLALHNSDTASISKHDDNANLERRLLRKLDCTYVYLSSDKERKQQRRLMVNKIG